jgi:hypothetical protein
MMCITGKNRRWWKVWVTGRRVIAVAAKDEIPQLLPPCPPERVGGTGPNADFNGLDLQTPGEANMASGYRTDRDAVGAGFKPARRQQETES